MRMAEDSGFRGVFFRLNQNMEEGVCATPPHQDTRASACRAGKTFGVGKEYFWWGSTEMGRCLKCGVRDRAAGQCLKNCSHERLSPNRSPPDAPVDSHTHEMIKNLAHMATGLRGGWMTSTLVHGNLRRGAQKLGGLPDEGGGEEPAALPRYRAPQRDAADRPSAETTNARRSRSPPPAGLGRPSPRENSGNACSRTQPWSREPSPGEESPRP